MIIACPCGKKKFNLDINLIPADGRLLKCGSCSEVWHYKIPSSEQKIFHEINNLETNKPDFTPDKNNDDFPIENKDINPIKEEIKTKKTRKYNKKTESKSKELISVKKEPEFSENKIIKKIFLILISIIAFILLLDTFKNQISIIFPGIINMSDSLYLVINDLKLFIKDLVR